eukprot:CAMPEP_0175490716 /NCGR_PEP_ID=MMETSP0096-20121207/1399_1 /TAXON_ID=311494 /ORGANISM="Alexandrium monilatum, Strain CCMP3105" /LENGTH=464 /DNA_ID=CAMNT_0016792635 /DNA_START=1 /DNA_END=1392 /DNA_ORIENTATION=+
MARLPARPPLARDESWDAEVAQARAQLAALRGDLAELRAKQASLQKVADDARTREALLQGELAAVLRQGAELQREDVEHLIYTDEGWGPWEDDFRGLWEPLAPEPPLSEPRFGAPQLAGGAGGGRPLRRLRADELLGSAAACGGGGGSSGSGSSASAVVVSERPLMVMVPDFATAEECAGLIELGFRSCKPHNKWAQEAQRPGMQRAKGTHGPLRGVATASLTASELASPEDRELLERMQSRVAALTGVPDHGKEIRPFLKFDQPGEGRADPSSQEDDLSIGLHQDVNGGFDHCVCSVIVYLNSCAGGRTVFPCAGDERSQVLGNELTAAGHTHTSHRRVHEAGSGLCAAELVERAEAAPGALRIAPRRGAAVLFFTLLGEEGDAGLADGPPARDPWSWHGGAAVQGRLGKWTLQIFKEVPLEHRGGPREAAYVGALRRRALGAAATAEASGDEGAGSERAAAA